MPKKKHFLSFDEEFIKDLQEAREISVDSLGRVYGLEAAFQRIWRGYKKR